MDPNRRYHVNCWPSSACPSGAAVSPGGTCPRRRYTCIHATAPARCMRCAPRAGAERSRGCRSSLVSAPLLTVSGKRTTPWRPLPGGQAQGFAHASGQVASDICPLCPRLRPRLAGSLAFTCTSVRAAAGDRMNQAIPSSRASLAREHTSVRIHTYKYSHELRIMAQIHSMCSPAERSVLVERGWQRSNLPEEVCAMPANPSSLRMKKLAAGLSVAISLIGVEAHAFASVIQVTSCADDNTSGALRQVVAKAASGDVVDLSRLSCGNNEIFLTRGEIVIAA